jgi:hypothetical protein
LDIIICTPGGKLDLLADYSLATHSDPRNSLQGMTQVAVAGLPITIGCSGSLFGFARLQKPRQYENIPVCLKL